MFQVDNSGHGNCMYYAYSISLMYFLRTQSNPLLTDNIFNKLKLSGEEKYRLQTLLSQDSNQEFTRSEIKKIIEPILGRAARRLAAEHTKVEFKTSPQDTPLFTAGKYGLEFCFQQFFKQSRSGLSRLIDHDFTNRNFTEAEVYKMSGTDRAMTNYAKHRVSDVIKEFYRLWAIKEKEWEKESGDHTEDEVRFQQEIILDNILRSETVNFFLTENENYLNLYIDHLRRESVWGTEETLFVLHRAIQGERMIRNSKGTIDTFYDNEIVLHLHRNGRSPFMQFGSPVMILNNQNNIHWVSMIPDSIFVKAKSVEQSKTRYPVEISYFLPENKQTGPKIAKTLRQMYLKGLQGDERYSPDRCKEIAMQYLNYVADHQRRFQLTDVKYFIEDIEKRIQHQRKMSQLPGPELVPELGEVNESCDSEIPLESVAKEFEKESKDKEREELDPSTRRGLMPPILPEYPIPSGEQRESMIKAKKFTHPYSREQRTILYGAIYEWVDSLTEKSFKNLIRATLKKYEGMIWGSFWGASRRSEVEGYLSNHSNAKVLALIFMKGVESSTLNELLFTKIVEIIKKEISNNPAMLEEQKYQLLAQFDVQHSPFYAANLKSHQHTIDTAHRESLEHLTLT
ncbi:Dot/Icm T4SS effector [Legionella wadsworthii]|uniref:Dot/Icm T4SS effector n=1 Tax=Legionella wadsworthii TaxID=28088 RepID=A0A378LP37_9GAMM|nr:hypothetical protein [Legionella wadsworthii]STY28523.1 Dot/Icm T4SS effector [Legionella wadsworthii]